MGLITPVIALAFTSIVRSTPGAENRNDDASALLLLTTWLSKDVSSTSETGFFVGSSAPAGTSCATSGMPSSFKLLELHWTEGARNYVTEYRWVSTNASEGRIWRFACQRGLAADQTKLTPDLNSVAASPSHPFAPAPVQIVMSPTTTASGTPGNKGLQFAVLIYDDFGVQRELLSLDATTTNVRTTLPPSSGTPTGNNSGPIANNTTVSIQAGTAATNVPLAVTDPDAGDLLSASFPSGLPVGWNVVAIGTSVDIAPDPLATAGTYAIAYSVTDTSGETASAQLIVNVTVVAPNLAPSASPAVLNASKGVAGTVTLSYSDPEGESLTPVLDATDIPSGWTTSVLGKVVTITPSTTATGTTVIDYSVTDSFGNKAIASISVSVCTVSLVSVSPANKTVVVKSNGDIDQNVDIVISTNGACSALVLGFLPNSPSGVETNEAFNASDAVQIKKHSSYAWTRPAASTTRVVPLHVRQGANGPIELTINLTTTR